MQPACRTCDSCLGRPFPTSLQLCRISHAYRAVLQGSSQVGIPQLQLVCDQPSSMAGMQGHGAREMLGCGPEGDFCTGKSPKNVSSSNIFMPKSIILSHGQEWMWDLILWDSKDLGKGGWNLFLLAFLILQTCPLLSCGFFPFLLLPAPCYVPREGSVLASIAPVVWVNRDSLLLTSVHKPYSLLKVSFK